MEYDTGLARHELLYLASQLNKADKNRDGKIVLEEWENWIQVKGKRPFQNKKAMGGMMQVLAYSPTYSCNPPTLFIIIITLLEVLFYLLW